jgi:hypothetical protein
MHSRRHTLPLLRICAIYRGIFISFRYDSKFLCIYCTVFFFLLRRTSKYALRNSKYSWKPVCETPVASHILLFCMLNWPVPSFKLSVPGHSQRRPRFVTRPVFCGNCCRKSDNRMGFLFLPVFRGFFLSVSFNLCSILIHLSIINAI